MSSESMAIVIRFFKIQCLIYTIHFVHSSAALTGSSTLYNVMEQKTMRQGFKDKKINSNIQ